ncbi:MAG TPA: hypothetical protein VK212_06025 [Lentimicrobium sp.]|nr:hypothetical protein [Lentimicrobium sp.]
MDRYKRIVTEFLILSFVEDYDFNRQYVDHLNRELEEMNIPYRYTYDEFCIELMNRFLSTIDQYCTDNKAFDELSDKFGVIVFRTVREMKMNIVASKHSSFQQV